MKQLSTYSSVFILGTTFGLLMKGWLKPGKPLSGRQDEEVHLYL